MPAPVPITFHELMAGIATDLVAEESRAALRMAFENLRSFAAVTANGPAIAR